MFAILEFFTRNLLWTAGRTILFITLPIVVLSYFVHMALFMLSCAWLIFCLYFFRNPSRLCPEALRDKQSIVCPADGRIMSIDTIADPELGTVQRIAIFLSPLDVHVTRIPISGVIKNIDYRPGKFIVAYAPKSSASNERNDLLITTAQGCTIRVRQIAGFVARRICWWVKTHDSVCAGSIYGMIRFGSRVDLHLPTTTQIYVQTGQVVRGGETVIGRLLC